MWSVVTELDFDCWLVGCVVVCFKAVTVELEDEKRCAGDHSETTPPPVSWATVKADGVRQ